MKDLELFYGKRAAQLGDLSLGGDELRYLFCRPPFDIKIYLALRAFATDGEVSAPVNSIAGKVRGWMRYCEISGGKLLIRNSEGEFTTLRYSSEKELVDIRKAMKRLEADGLVVTDKRERGDGRIESVCTFPLAGL